MFAALVVRDTRGLEQYSSPEVWVFALVRLIPYVLTFCLACYRWLWQTFGKEIIRIGSGTMSIKRDILGVGRARTFPAHDISGLRGIDDAEFAGSRIAKYLKSHGVPLSSLRFEHKGTTVRFGAGLDAEDAGALVTRLKSYLPRSAFMQRERGAVAARYQDAGLRAGFHAGFSSRTWRRTGRS